MYKVLDVPLEQSLQAFSCILNQQRIAHKITEKSNKLEVWCYTQENKIVISQYYSQWIAGELQPIISNELTQNQVNKSINITVLSHYSITIFLIVLSLIISLIIGFGSSIEMLSYFTFVKLHMINNNFYFGSLQEVWETKEYWRLITPIFYHFGFIHIAFNMLWLFEIGKKIEVTQGKLHLLFLIVTTGIISNFAQYYVTQSAFFGGFSGVIYAFFGYCLLRSKIDTKCQFDIPNAIYWAMFIWLALGYTGFFEIIGVGSIANTAHLSGLISGAVIGLIAGVVLKK